MNFLLKDFIYCAHNSDITKRLKSIGNKTVIDQLHTVRDFISRNIKMNPDIMIYGFTTQPGHRDSKHVCGIDSSRYELDFLRCHAINNSDLNYSQFYVKCITLAKINSIYNGGTGISVSTFNKLLDFYFSNTCDLNVPQRGSYSSGDVIPAAHWALEFVQRYKVKLQSGDSMALINGNFVHLGVCAANIPIIGRFLGLVAHLYVGIGSLANENIFRPVNHLTHEDEKSALYFRFIQDRLEKYRTVKLKTSPQNSVSIRAMPEIIELLSRAENNIEREANALLTKKSGNPIFIPETDEIISQSSFLAPKLSLAESGMVDAILFFLNALQGQMSFILSGRFFEVPLDAVFSENDIGLIQIPKLIDAKIQNIRERVVGRPFLVPISQSYGVEDLCDYGLNLSSVIMNIIPNCTEIILICLSVFEYINQVVLNRSFIHVEIKEKERTAEDTIKACLNQYKSDCEFGKFTILPI